MIIINWSSSFSVSTSYYHAFTFFHFIFRYSDHMSWYVLEADGILCHIIWTSMIHADVGPSIVHLSQLVWYHAQICKRMALSCIKRRWFMRGKWMEFFWLRGLQSLKKNSISKGSGLSPEFLHNYLKYKCRWGKSHQPPKCAIIFSFRECQSLSYSLWGHPCPSRCKCIVFHCIALPTDNWRPHFLSWHLPSAIWYVTYPLPLLPANQLDQKYLTEAST